MKTKTSYKKGHKGYWLGKKRLSFSKKTREKMSKSHKGINPHDSPNWRHPWKGKNLPIELRTKFSLAKLGKTGKLSNGWKGGITPINILLRQSLDYEEWRTKVFERDLYTCQHCGKVGGYLEADHIKPFSIFKELRLELNNGRTLCKFCHIKTETYGGRVRKYAYSK